MKYILLSYVLYFALATIGATYGLHRYWAHNMGTRKPWFEWVSLICALLIGLYKPLGWVAAHRLHHRHADTELDPHSPKHKGFWKVILSIWTPDMPASVIRDLVKNPRIKFMQRYGKWFIIPVILISPLTVLFGFLGIGILNYFGHKDGKPVSKWYINILAPFEGNHKDHHE